MLIGCCTNMLPKTESGTGYEYAAAIRKAGFDYIELPAAQVNELSEPAFQEMLACLEAASLPVYACNNFFPACLKLVGPDVDAGRVRESFQGALERAARMRCRYVVFGSPWSKTCPDGFPARRAFEQLALWCQEIGREARKKEIIIALEANNRQETNMITTFAQAVSLAKAADHPNVRCLQDYYHWRVEGDTADSLLACGREFLVHSHFARLEGRGFPAGMEEDRCYHTYFQALKQLDYQGGISLEGFPASRESFAAEAARACRFLRQAAN